MALILAGISFRTAPIEIREKLVVSGAQLPAFLQQLQRDSQLSEVVALSTCNRTEVYAVSDDAEDPAAIWSALSARLGSDAAQFGYVRSDREAAMHLFRVAAGMDSMILGEAQIHGQVRESWEFSRASSGAMLNRLFQTALYVAARVREETAIARGAASVSSAAVQLARQIFGSLNGRSAMVLGSGEMAELALESLVREGVRAAIVANRTYERAQQLGEQYGATPMHYDACWEHLRTVDVLISSTSAPHALVSYEHIRAAMEGRQQPLCILDIALPRDVDARARELENVFLYDLDDLSAVVASNIEKRKGELPTAEALIASEAERFWQWVAGLQVVPVLTRFRTRMDEVRAAELSNALRRLQHLSEEDQAVLEHFSRSLMNKFLHNPSVRLREAAANGRGLGIIDATQYLFRLEAEDAAPTDAAGDDKNSEDVGNESG